MSSEVYMPPTTPDNLHHGKTPRQICICVVERLNMIFLVFFICYLSWSIPANYGLFTSTSAHSNSSLDSDKHLKSEDVNSTEKRDDDNLLFNFTVFSSKLENTADNISVRQIEFTKQKKRQKDKKRKNKRRKGKVSKSNNSNLEKTSDKKHRKHKKCRKCSKRKKMQSKFRKQKFRLEPTTIRHIIERVAEEALQKGAGSMDFGINYNPFKTPKDSLSNWSQWSECSVTCNSGQKRRSRHCGISCRESETMVCFMPSCKKDNKKKKGDGESRQTDTYLPPSSSVGYINEDVDTCEEWIECNNQTIKKYLRKSLLPSCPCYYPLHLDYDDKVWDRQKQNHFKWQDIIFSDESINNYKPQAEYCIRSKLYNGTKTLAAQSCCYDDTMRLITRGKSAGTPNLISPEISPELHQKLDINPWIICKGDWTRYNEVIKPNNDLSCRKNPNQDELEVQIFQAQNY